jgi:hypothetical protein
MSTARIIRHCVLICGGFTYLALVLFAGFEMPVFGIAFILAASFEVINAHRSHGHAGISSTDPSDRMNERICGAAPKYLRQ